MKKCISSTISVLSLLVFISVTSCGTKQAEHDFVVPSKTPAQALTIGWYAPVNVLQELVGPSFEPSVIKEDSIGTIMIYIVAGSEHNVDSITCGELKAAYLVIPVKKPGNLKSSEASTVSNTLVCPMNIVDVSPVLGNRFHDFGFPTYTGKINLDVKWSGDKYHVTASIETSNGLIEIAALFEEEPQQLKMTTAIFNPKSSNYSYFYGDEQMKQIINGKGNLKTDGENIIKAMNLSGQPYYMKLDLDVSWQFDFVKE